MSYIQKMSVQGIRSFGPDDRNRQVIEFFTPLTLILGTNGSGKTTLIECLRYVTTGDMPPNSGRGGSFVHDPKVAGEPSVKAQIKLQFKDVTGKSTVATRSLEAVQRLKRLEVRTLDSTISRKTAVGDRESISSKCVEINREMVMCFGVSKAVLNNVIFCHQEESGWPLSEGKALKQRFDEIFAATRYIKALDSIKDIRSKQVTEHKNSQTELRYLKQHKEKAVLVRKDLSKMESRLSASRDRCREIGEKLRPVTRELDEIAEKRYEIQQLQRQMDKMDAIIQQQKKSMLDLKNNIKEIFDGSMDELKEKISNFQKEREGQQRKLEQLERQNRKVSQEVDALGKRKSDLLHKLGRMELEEQQHQATVTVRDEHVKKLCPDIASDLQEGQKFSKTQVEQALDLQRRKEQKSQDQIRETKSKFDAAEKDMQHRIEKLRDEKTKCDHIIKLGVKKIEDNRAEIASITEELRRASSSAARMKTLEAMQKKKEGELAALASSLDVDAAKSAIQQKKIARTAQETELQELNETLRQMHQESRFRTELEMHLKEKAEKEDSIQKIKDKHAESLQHILGHVPVENVRMALEEQQSLLSSEVKKYTKKLQDVKSSLSSCETSQKFHRQELETKERELANHKKRITDVCSGQDLETAINNSQLEIKTLQDDKGALVGSQHVFKKYQKQLREETCCPLCHRDFPEGRRAAEALVSELEANMKQLPSQIEDMQHTVENKQQLFNRMLELRPVRETTKKLLEVELPTLRRDIQKDSEEIEKFLHSIQQTKTVLQTKQADLQLCSSMQTDAALLDRTRIELRQLEKKIASISYKLGDSTVSTTAEEIDVKIEAARREITVLNTEMESLQQQVSEHQDQQQQLKGNINDIRAELLGIESRLQKRCSMEEQRAKLDAEIAEKERQLMEAKQQAEIMEEKLQDLKEEKEVLMCQKDGELEVLRETLQKHEKDRIKLQDYIRDVDIYVKQGKSEKLKRHQEEVQQIEEEAVVQIAEQKDLQHDVTQLQEAISLHTVKEREYQDNLSLRQLQEETSEKEQEKSQVVKQMGKYATSSLYQREKELTTLKDDLRREQQEAEGRQDVMEEQVSHLQKELNSEMYRDIDNRYRKSLIQVHTLKMASDDLNKYYKALDIAVMKYHKMKMNEINKIIRELWERTYAGSDIDYIEIKSEEDEEHGGLDKRRVYNYRVVMVKGDTMMDVRGRCSAGQKVLASLIIRLALAETFCLNCGIIALDEPTTNLDRDNIEKLAMALVELVDSRSQQHNFQLLIITHDEDFVEKLCRVKSVDYFYKVDKDPRGLSRITKSTVGHFD